MPLTNEQYDVLMRGYQEKQLERKETIRDRRTELYECIPDLKSIDAEMAELAVLSVKSRLFDTNGEAADPDGVSEHLKRLSAVRENLIRDAGYPADYLEPPYNCPDCKDTGFIEGVPCHCYKQASMDLIAQYSDITIDSANLSFSDFLLDMYDEDDMDPLTNESARRIASKALAEAVSFTEDFGGHHDNLLIYGQTGVGKTFLSNIIASELRQKEYTVLYLTTFRLFSILEDRKFSHRDQVGNITNTSYRELFSCDLLIIDDLGTELSNSFTTSALFELLNERILSGRSTVISSNLSLSAIKENYSERLFSRIMEHYSMIRLYGNDIRIKKKLGGDTNAA